MGLGQQDHQGAWTDDGGAREDQNLGHGPDYRKNQKFAPAFKFKTVVGVTPDNRVPIKEVADEIKKIVGGTA